MTVAPKHSWMLNWLRWRVHNSLSHLHHSTAGNVVIFTRSQVYIKPKPTYSKSTPFILGDASPQYPNTPIPQMTPTTAAHDLKESWGLSRGWAAGHRFGLRGHQKAGAERHGTRDPLYSPVVEVSTGMLTFALRVPLTMGITEHVDIGNGIG